jgi:hypothetical protein
MKIDNNDNLSIKDFNFIGLDSKLINHLKEDNDDNLDNLNITININKQDLNDFNKRIITPKNINNIIKICDYFLIDKVKEFLIENSIPTFEKYKIDNYELSNKPKYELPIFMTKGMSVINYNKLHDFSYLFENEDEDFVYDKFYNYLSTFSNSVQEMASLNLINWIDFYLNNMNSEYEKEFLDVTKYAAFYNNKDCLEYLHNNKIEEYDENTCAATAYKNNLDLLKFLHQQNCPWNNLTCAAAANTGSLECLKYAHQNGCEMDYLTLSEAGRNGHIECMKYAIENGCSFLCKDNHNHDYESTCLLASSTNQIDSFKFAVDNGCPIQWSLVTAARCGNSEMVKYIFENHYKSMSDINNHHLKILSRAAIKSGDLETVKYSHQVVKSSLLEKDEVMYCYRNEVEHCTLVAATSESSDVLNYLLENNIKLDKDSLKYALMSNSEKCVDYILNLPSEINKICLENERNNYINLAIKSKNLSLLKKMFELFPKDREKMFEPYDCDNFECWNFLISKNIKFKNIKIDYYNPQYIFKWISNFEYIKMHEKLKILWDYELPAVLGFYGQYEFLKYVVDKGCLVDKRTILKICSDNTYIDTSKLQYYPDKFACFKYAFENNFEYNSDLCDKCSNKKIINYLINKNIKMSNEVINNHLYEDNIDIADKLINLGYQINVKTVLSAFYFYRRKKTKFLETYSNVENENNLYYKRLIYYLNICPELSSELFYSSLDNNCLEIIPELIRLKCPINEKIFHKFIFKLNTEHYKFLIYLFNLIIQNYDIKLNESLLYHSSKSIYPPYFKNFLIENKCEGYEKYANNNNNIEFNYNSLFENY